MKDTILEEVRRTGDAFAAKFRNEVHAMFEELPRQQQIGSRHIVSFTPRKVEQVDEDCTGKRE
jgi:hypothetical protein